MTDLEDAWRQIDAATPPGWFVGQPSRHDDPPRWIQYAFDPAERPKAGARSREWEAVAATELGVLREMARCLAEIKEGRVPR